MALWRLLETSNIAGRLLMPSEAEVDCRAGRKLWRENDIIGCGIILFDSLVVVYRTTVFGMAWGWIAG